MRFPYKISVCIFVSLTCVTYLVGVSLSPDLTDSVLLNDLYESQKYCSRVELYGINVQLLQGCGSIVIMRQNFC